MRYFFIAAMLLIAVLMVVFSDTVMAAAVTGLYIFGTSIFPSLFPFFVCSRFINSAMTKKKNISTPLLLISSWFVSAVCGTPTGAVCSKTLLDSGKVKADFASILCACFNQMGPLFICGAFASSIIGVPRLGVLFLTAHYAPSLIFVVCAALFYGRKKAAFEKTGLEPLQLNAPSISFVTLIVESISEATMIILRVGGTIVFSRVICSVISRTGILSALSIPMQSMLLGMLEFTNGIYLVCASGLSLRTCCAVCCGLMSFGGFCIFIQSRLVIDLKAFPYFAAKMVYGILSFVICYFLFPQFFGSEAVFSDMSPLVDTTDFQNRIVYIAAITICVLFSIVASVIYAALVTRRTGKHI